MNRLPCSLYEAFKLGFKRTLDHMGLLFVTQLIGFGLMLCTIVVALLFFGFTLVPKMMSLMAEPPFSWDISLMTVLKYGISVLIFWLLYNLIRSGYEISFRYMTLEIVDRDDSSIAALWSRWQLALNYWLATTTFGFFVGLGFMFFVIPGLMVYTTFLFYPQIMADKKIGFLSAFSESARLTRGYRLSLLGFVVLSYGINAFAGILTSGIGLLVTIPVTLIAKAYVYRSLQARRADNVL